MNNLTLDEIYETLYSRRADCAGRPDPKMTNKQWQQKFNILKLGTTPVPYKRMTAWQAESQTNYTGETEYSRYVTFINDVLRVIRSGNCDYCYFVYQIKDLLRFEKNRLRTEYLPHLQAFRVWLD